MSLFCIQETFWRIPAKISVSQLRSAAAALSPREEEPQGDKEQDGSRDPTRESQEEEGEEKEEKEGEDKEEEEVEVSGEQRAQALRALQLTRKRKHHTSEHTGMCGSFNGLCLVSDDS